MQLDLRSPPQPPFAHRDMPMNDARKEHEACSIRGTKVASYNGPMNTFRRRSSLTPHPPQCPIGLVIANHRLMRLLGKGASGSVFEAVHVQLNRSVAIKILHEAHVSNPQKVSRFVTEARALSLIRHPSVIEVYDIGQTSWGTYYILMEHVNGELLAKRIDAMSDMHCKPSQRARCAVSWGHQLAATLTSVHANGVIHRDLSPSNICLVRDPLVQGGERIKLFDFGIAKIVSERAIGLVSPLAGIPLHARTVQGATHGTMLYMAPEQWRGDQVATEQTDVYALGSLIFHVISGIPPFDADSIPELREQHLHAPPPPLPNLPALAQPPMSVSLQTRLSELVDTMLNKGARQRPTMAQVVSRLSTLEMEVFAHSWIQDSGMQSPAGPTYDWQISDCPPLTVASLPKPRVVNAHRLWPQTLLEYVRKAKRWLE